MQSWGTCLKLVVLMRKRKVSWCSPFGVLKFNVAEAARAKPELAGIEGVLRNHKGEVMYMFFKHVGIKDSIEAKVLANLEALSVYHTLYHRNLVVEGDSANILSEIVKRAMENAVLQRN